MSQQNNNNSDLLSQEALALSDDEELIETQVLEEITVDVNQNNFPLNHESYLTSAELIQHLKKKYIVNENFSAVLPPSIARAIYIKDDSRKVLWGLDCSWNEDVEMFKLDDKYTGMWNIPFIFNLRIFTCWMDVFYELHLKAGDLNLGEVRCCVCFDSILDFRYPGSWHAYTETKLFSNSNKSKNAFYICDLSTVESFHALCEDCFDNLITTPKQFNVPGHFGCPLCNVRPRNWLMFAIPDFTIEHKFIAWVRRFYDRLRLLIKTTDLDVLSHAMQTTRVEYETALNREVQLRVHATELNHALLHQIEELKKSHAHLKKLLFTHVQNNKCVTGTCRYHLPAILRTPRPQKRERDVEDNINTENNKKVEPEREEEEEL